MEVLIRIPYNSKEIQAVLTSPETSIQSTTTSNDEEINNDVKCMVVLTHGAGGDMNSEQLCVISKHLVKAGFKVLRFTCKPPNFVYRSKVFSTVLEYTKTELKAEKVVIGGRSMGGRVAAYIASNRTDSMSHLIGVFCISYPLHKAKEEHQVSMLRTSHLEGVKQIPLLIINGTEDEMCNFEVMERVFGTLENARKELCWIKDADHSLKIRGRLDRGGQTKTLTSVCESLIDWCHYCSLNE